MESPDPRARVLGLSLTAWRAASAALIVLAAFAALLPPRGTPGLQIADLGEVRALALHGLGYAVLAFCVLVAQREPRPGVTAIGLVAYGVALEFAQGLGGMRSAQVTDALANATGVGVGVVAALLVLRRRSVA